MTSLRCDTKRYFATKCFGRTFCDWVPYDFRVVFAIAERGATCNRAAGTFPPSLPSAVGTGFEIELLGTPSQIRGERAPGSFGEEVERFSAWHRRRVTALPSMPPPAGGRGAGAAGGTARGVRESSRASDRGGFVSDAARASEVEKENAARAHVGGKRRRVPGLHHDLIVEDAPDGFPLSQVDDETGEARTVVSWKSVSPPRFRAPGPAAGAGPSRAGGAVVNQLLRIGRGSAAAMQQAKAREDTRRRVCEQLDTWDERALANAADADAADRGRRREGAGNDEQRSSSNVAAAALLADVQAMCAEPAGTPGSAGRPSIGMGPLGAAQQRTPGSARRDAEVPPPKSSRPERSDPEPSERSEPGRTRSLTTDVVTVHQPSIVPGQPPTVAARRTSAPPEPKKPFECDWGDDDPDADFDLAAAAAAAEAAHRARGGGGAVEARGGLQTAATSVTGSETAAPNVDVAAPNAAPNDAASVRRGDSRDLEPSSDAARREREAREWRVEAEGAALGAFRVVSVSRVEGRLDLRVRPCGDANGGADDCDPVATTTDGDRADGVKKNERTIRCHDAWAETRALPGDLVLVASPFNASKRKALDALDDPDGDRECIDVTIDGDDLLVMHPGTLVNSTAVGGSMQCLRRAVLQTVVPDGGGGDHSQAAMLGTLSHDLCEGSLMAAAFNTGPGAIGFYKHSEAIVRDNASRLFAAGVSEKEALDRLRYVGPGVHKWSRSLVRRCAPLPSGAGVHGVAPAPAPAPPGVVCEVLDGPGRRSRGNVVLTKMVDAEETVWAPRLGLRGVVDAVAVGKLESVGVDGGADSKPSVSSGIVPVELKTGYWRSPVEHGAQLSLYTLMLAERYKQRVPFGLLHYTRHPGGGTAAGAASRNKKDDETLAIRPGKRDLAFLMLRRNALAGALCTNRGGSAADGEDAESRDDYLGSGSVARGGVPFALGALPPMEQCRSECERCFVRDACLTVNAALEGGAERSADPAIAALARETVGHITPALAKDLKRWLALVDMEAAASAARRATPWMPVEDVRRRGAFAVAGLKLAPSKKFASAEGQGGVSANSRRYDLSEDEETDGSAAAEEKARTKNDGSGSAPRPFVYKLYLPSASSSGEKSKSTDLAALRAGDRLVLSRERGGVVVGRVIVLDVVFDPLPHEVASGIEYAVAARVESERVVRFHGPGAATDADAWRVDRDDGGGTMSGRARAALVDAFASTNERAVALRRRLFELAPPAFDFDAADDALQKLSPSGAAIVSALNDEQRSAVRGVLAARDYALIQGFPGAGKSATLAAIVRALVDAGKSVLVTSHTHSAVDNVLERLPGVGVDAFVRAGGEGGKASAAAAAFCPGGAKHAARSVEELRALADASAVVGATCYAAANHPLIARRRARRSARASAEETRDAAKNEHETETGFFDVVLVDEAGQMTLPASVPALLRGAVFVLVGDPAQLPPLVQSERAAAAGLSISPMQALAEAHPAAVFQLTAQYRMADDLAVISNVISYGGALRAANEQVASRVMRCLLSKTETDVVRALGLGSLGSANAEDSRQKNQRDAAWLVAASDPNRRVVFLDTSDGGDAAFETSDAGVARESKSGPVRGNKHVNAYERFIVMRVLEALRARGAEPGSVAVLSPYNSQVDELDAELRRREAGTGDFGDAGNPEGNPFDLPIPEGVEALTIDRAQGRDVDCVVLSFCRANEARDAGRLLADRRRLNVALTRARSKLVLVGHGKTLARSPVLSQVLGVVLKNGWMVHLPPVT